jgi:hypothetical protein
VLAITRPAGLEWLGSAEVHAEGTAAWIRVPIPPDVLSKLLGAAQGAL